MKKITIAILTIMAVMTINCKNEKNRDNKVQAEPKKVETQLKNTENIINQKIVILYMPDSIELAKIEKEKSEEELNSIEYYKTMAVNFLGNRDMNYSVETRKEYLFRLSSGKIDTIDKTKFQNWGAIFFKPEKSPKVVFLNEIESEFDLYFK